MFIYIHVVLFCYCCYFSGVVVVFVVVVVLKQQQNIYLNMYLRMRALIFKFYFVAFFYIKMTTTKIILRTQ